MIVVDAVNRSESNMVLSNHPNWVFVSFVRGSFGHVLSRCLMTSTDAKWYDHPANGKHPWHWNHFPVELGIGVSPGHFLKFFKLADSNALRARIEVPSFGVFENKGGRGDFSQMWLTQLLDAHRIIYPVHYDSAYIKKHFPNSKIVTVDIAPEDWKQAVINQIQATGNYPAFGAFDATHEKQQWRKKTNQNSMRDWEKYSNNLNDQEWVVWTANQMKDELEILNSQKHLADTVFSTKDRTSVDAIIKLHEDLGMTYNKDLVQKVLDSFNYTRLI